MRLPGTRKRFSYMGRVVIITGGSRGLGLLMARQLRKEGARVALLARNREELMRAKEQLGEDDNVLTIACDVAERALVRQAVEIVAHHFGRIDMLINNAGIIQVGPLQHMTYGDYHHAMNVHFWGALHCTEAVLPYMRQRRCGRIVNIASIGGLIAVPHLAPYSASKFALVGYSDAVRAEVAKDGIRVTTVCPGLMRTGLGDKRAGQRAARGRVRVVRGAQLAAACLHRCATRGAKDRRGSAPRSTASDDYASGATRGDSRSDHAQHVRQDDGARDARAAGAWRHIRKRSVAGTRGEAREASTIGHRARRSRGAPQQRARADAIESAGWIARASDSRPHRPATCTSAVRGRPCSTGCSRAATAAPSFCASKTPTLNDRPTRWWRAFSSRCGGSASTGMKVQAVEGPHAPYFQTQRFDRHRAAAHQLAAQGDAYKCYCSPERLKEQRDASEKAGGAWKYDRRVPEPVR